MTIEKIGLPNEFTQGEVGDIYIDTDTGFKFECTSKISIKAGEDTNIKYIWMPVHENYKQMVEDAVAALSDKLHTEVSKDGLIAAIGGIGVGTVVQAVVKKADIKLVDITDTSTDMPEYLYKNKQYIKSIIFKNATSISNGAMNNCMSLLTVSMPNATNIISNAMAGCVSLVSIDMPNATDIGVSAMANCLSLVSVNLPNAKSIGNNAMLNCLLLVSIDMHNVTNIGTNAMANCLSLKKIILGASQVCTMSGTNAFANTPIANGTGFIYVPDDLVNSYKIATNWSTYASQIRPMSEYVEEV